ncbi:MAG: hypothetical protein GDA48_15795 [Hormoscilla sp. GM102CHS1]|nr:hypothetical protein [Hormoscilla sp. GM102CHS1]
MALAFIHFKWRSHDIEKQQFIGRSHQDTAIKWRSHLPGHGDTNIFIVTNNLLMPCPYIIFVYLLPQLRSDRLTSNYNKIVW